jgi:hypothetical protein
MKIKILSIVALLFSASFFTACEKDDPEIEYTATKEMNGEWYVTYKRQNASGQWVNNPYGVGYTRLSTYNTAANTPDQLWVSDAGNFWNYQVKTTSDLGAKSFSANDVTSVALDSKGKPYDIKVTITDGKIIEKGGRSKTGVEVDSIAFTVQFEDEAFPYLVTGHRRTGFLEDEYH